MIRRLLLALTLAVLVTPAFGQTAAFNGFCQIGGKFVSTTGLNSTTKVQASYPQCTVTVYATGTTNISTLFSNATSSPLANPFQANTDGSFLFFASTTGCYDVVTSVSTSGGTPPMPTPFTYTDVCLGSGGGGGGGVTISGTPYQVSRFNAAGNNVTDSSGSDNPANGPTQWVNGLSVMANGLAKLGVNSPNGTTVNLLACADPTVTTMTQFTTCPAGANKAKGVVDTGAGTTGNVQIYDHAYHACVFDNQTAVSDYAAPSTVNPGQCSDVGGAKPNNVEILGTITTINSGNGTLATVDWFTGDTIAPGSGGGSGTVSTCAQANSNALFALAGTVVTCDIFVTDDSAGNMTMFSLGLTNPNYAGFYYQKQGPAPPTTPANSVAEYPPTSVTAYAEKRPGAVGIVGQTRVINSLGTDPGGNPIAVEAWGSAGGTSVTLQTNAVNNASQSLLNFINGNASFGYSVNPVNPSGGQERMDITTPFIPASDPTAPTLTPTNPGTTHYTYGVAGCEDPGCTRHSALVTTATTTGNATISGSNPIKLTAYADTLYGYRFYVICRTASSGSPASVGVIASGAWKQYSDNGITADGSTCGTTYASNNTKLDDHCLGGNPSIANAALSVPCGIDTPPASPKALNDEFTAGGAGSPGDSNNPFWVWRNQGTSTATLTNGELIFIPQPGSGADSFRLLTQTSPSTPWTFVTAALPLFTQGSNNQLLGMCVGDGTKFESWIEKAVSNGELEVDRWTNTTTFSANQYGLTIIGAAYPWTWFKLQNDGTNLNFSHSFDGINYFQDYTEAKGAFLGTITEIGVCGESTSTAATPQLSVDYFRETQ